jgi:hypothetical protein
VRRSKDFGSLIDDPERFVDCLREWHCWLKSSLRWGALTACYHSYELFE